MKNIFLSIILVSLFLSLTPALAYAICEGPIVPCGRDLNEMVKLIKMNNANFVTFLLLLTILLN